MARISRSLNGDKIVWIAREKREGAWVVIARADTEKALNKMLNPPAKKSAKKK